MDGTRFCPLAGAAFFPPATLESARPVVQVTDVPKQVLRTKIFSMPLIVLARLEASDEKAMSCPLALMLGCSLRPFPGVVPFAVETNVVDGVHTVV